MTGTLYWQRGPVFGGFDAEVVERDDDGVVLAIAECGGILLIGRGACEDAATDDLVDKLNDFWPSQTRAH